MLTARIKKYFNSASSEESKWFAKRTCELIYKDMKASKEFIATLKAFYSTEIKCSIVRLAFDKKYVMQTEGEYIYILLDYSAKEVVSSGRRLEQSISDTDKSIFWIRNNKLLVFYPDNAIMHQLSQML